MPRRATLTLFVSFWFYLVHIYTLCPVTMGPAASRSSVYVYSEYRSNVILLVWKRNTLPLSSHGSDEFTGYNIPHRTGHASSPANKDETMQHMMDNWKDMFR